MNYKVSIIMPVFNCEAYLQNAINSIINQTYTDWELLICDDFSTDGSFNILRSNNDKRIKIFKNQKNKGYLLTCNMLYSKCSGDYITFQDADDFCLDNRLEILLNEFKKDKLLCMCGSNYFRLIDNIKIISNYPLNYDEIINYVLENNQIPFCGSSIMIKKDIIKGNLFDPFFTSLGFEDYHLILKILALYKCKNIKEPIYHYTYNKQSVTKFFYQDPRKIATPNVIISYFKEMYKNNLEFIFDYNIVYEQIECETKKLDQKKLLKLRLANTLANYDFDSFFKLISFRDFNISYITVLIKRLLNYWIKRILR